MSFLQVGLHKMSDEEDTEQKLLVKEISEFRSARNGLFEWLRPINDVLDRIALQERDRNDKLQFLRAEKHDRETHKQTVQRLIEVEAELKLVKSENVKFSDTNNKLKLSLDQAAEYSKTQKIKIGELESRVAVAEREQRFANAVVQAHPRINDCRELQKQLNETRKLLNKTREELSGTRQRLSDVQERLTVAEQVTAATQQRELQESGNSEQLQLELTPQHHSTTHTGDVSIY